MGMKCRTVYDISYNDKQAIWSWLRREMSYRELGEILGVSHENVRVHLSGLLRQMYEEKELEINLPPYEQDEENIQSPS